MSDNQPRAASLVGYGLTTPRGVYQAQETVQDTQNIPTEEIIPLQEEDYPEPLQFKRLQAYEGPHTHMWKSDGVHNLVIKSGAGVSGSTSAQTKQVIVLHCLCGDIKVIDLLPIFYATEQ